ncbi:hypothetical protein MLD38_005589 [Melastoma candidum]|uniref:Uncharacterized protein n=1 Tax=Melastoma candidum TaxID=119954 RepID=A0ACB9RK89_9MYRT|nr:hypothetical protein MLD38_005589 [Melastoma candidum]
MSAAVHSGSKRSSSRFEEDFPAASASKKARRLSCSLGSQSPLPKAAVLAQLSACFPRMDARVLEKTLEECGDDIDAAVSRLQELCIGVEQNADPEDMSNAVEGTSTGNEEIPADANIPVEGSGWVELLVKEMSSASSFDDARARASRVLEALEQSICQRARSEAGQSFEKENMVLKQHIESLARDNMILKRAVALQHERQKDIEGISRELEYTKQLIPSYQEQLKKLELDNYTLSLQLKHAQLNQSVPRNFPPDVY